MTVKMRITLKPVPIVIETCCSCLVITNASVPYELLKRVSTVYVCVFALC